MKNLFVAGLVTGLTVVASGAHAAPVDLHGSDTLFGVASAAITNVGLDGALHYIGGGSGTGETGLVNGAQGIAPMSRALSTTAINNLLNQGVTPVQNVIGLDGVSIWVNAANATLASIDIPTIRSIYLCQTIDWANVASAGGKTGPIVVYARNGLSGTTDTFKTLIGGLPATTNGNANWGPCVHEVDTTDDIATNTSNDDNAIGFAGLSAGRPGNQALAVATTATSTAIAPSETTIREFSYPLSRRLYVNSVADGRFPSDDEQALLDAMLDRSFLDPILIANEFVTCPAVEDGGCP
jgi:phosphate transport system substrate-binding protein